MVNKKFPPNTAGGKMVTVIPRVQVGENIRDVGKMFLKKAKTFDVIDYVYVVDKNDVLQGVISIKEIIGASERNVKVEEVMKRDVIVVHPLTHQERVVYLALSHGIKAIPVVDKERHLLGVVPHDTILQIFNQEVHEDVFKFGGIFHRVGEEFTTIKSPASLMAKLRLPWLFVGVVGGIIAASIVTVFESVLSTFLTLAAFIPVLVYMSDAVGTQSETLIVRNIALDPKLSIKSYFLRELKVAIFLASICGLAIGAVALAGWRIPLLGIVVGLSMCLSILAAVFISTLLPLLFKKLNLDPAIVTGPFATMLSDIVTLAIYFSVAVLFLGYFGLL
ncbi:MAG: magnesium transporter [Candidatus Aenigmarchaeota archaeon]|nr:magnesium transporter [Candidatus Aenigmarchaeota archaeon]